MRLPAGRPIVTFSLLALTVLVFLGQLATKQIYGFDIPALLGIKANDLIVAGQWWRLFTPMLLHASIMHIAFNMYALYVLGADLERFYGSVRFLLLYIVAGFAGNVFSFILTEQSSLGASTAVFGIFGAQAVFLYQNRRLFGDRSRRALQQIAFLAVINFVIGLSPGIDNWGHLGGVLGGVAFAWFAGPIWRVEGTPPMPLRLRDARSPAQVAFTALGVFVLFAWLAVMAMP